jgi:hypothetical protein
VIGLVIAVAGAGLTTTSLTANAASVACGARCMTLASEQFGSGYVIAATTARLRIRFQPPGLAPAPAGSYQSDDFEAEYVGTVSEMYSFGIVTAAVDQSWPNGIGYEYVYAPGGNESGLCLGTAGTAAQGTPVALQACGVSGQTIWIVTASGGEFTPLVNGTDNRSFEPYVLTASTDNGPLTVKASNTLCRSISRPHGWYPRCLSRNLSPATVASVKQTAGSPPE